MRKFFETVCAGKKSYEQWGFNERISSALGSVFNLVIFPLTLVLDVSI
jgi:hypothetical protein